MNPNEYRITAPRPYHVGWFRRLRSSRLKFDERNDALVRVFHIGEIGCVAVATSPVIPEDYRFEFSDSFSGSIQRLAYSLASQFGPKDASLSPFNLTRIDVARYSLVKAEFTYKPGELHEMERARAEGREFDHQHDLVHISKVNLIPTERPKLFNRPPEDVVNVLDSLRLA
jgi:hypothetical protein